jgi:hypothetical protein
MKKFDVTKTLKTFAGVPIKEPGATREATVGDVILGCLMGHKFKDKKQNIRAWMLGTKIVEAEAPIDFEDADFDLIKEALAEMAAGAMVQGQVWNAVEEAEK